MGIQQITRELGKVSGGRFVASFRFVEPGRVYEASVPEGKATSFFVYLCYELFLSKQCCERDRSVIAGFHKNKVQQVLHGEHVSFLQLAGFPWGLENFSCDGNVLGGRIILYRHEGGH